jgi:sugar phosphate permease
MWMIGSSYFVLEMCRYALMFWLPLYLGDHLKCSLQVSGYVSSLYELVGGVKAAASAAGLIDGIGHLGALLSPYVVVFVSKLYGWDRLFQVFLGCFRCRWRLTAHLEPQAQRSRPVLLENEGVQQSIR